MIDALAELRACGEAQKAQDMARYHKAEREYLGVANPVLESFAKKWRAELTLDERLSLANDLWRTNIHEARVVAAKLLAQARLRPDDTAAWQLIASWVPEFDAWAIADHACGAGSKRLVWDPSRVDEVEAWTHSDHLWTKRAAMVITLPWTKQNNPKPAELETRDRVLGWAARYVEDPRWFIQKSVSWWLRDLSRHDPDRVRAFLAVHGEKMKRFAYKDASRLLP